MIPGGRLPTWTTFPPSRVRSMQDSSAFKFPLASKATSKAAFPTPIRESIFGVADVYGFSRAHLF